MLAKRLGTPDAGSGHPQGGYVLLNGRRCHLLRSLCQLLIEPLHICQRFIDSHRDPVAGRITGHMQHAVALDRTCDLRWIVDSRIDGAYRGLCNLPVAYAFRNACSQLTGDRVPVEVDPLVLHSK